MAIEEKKGTCAACLFSREHTNPYLVECHRHAPIARADGDAADWPVVSKGEWCGDYELSPEWPKFR